MIPSKAATTASRSATASGFRLLQLGDDRYAAAHPVHDLVHEGGVGRGAHERERDEVDAETQRELEVSDVLVGQRGHRHVGRR
jgi:hypothetical protein